MDKVYDLLVKARDVFAERGGAKNVLEDDDTHQVCAMGAINMALSGGKACIQPPYSCVDRSKYDWSSHTQVQYLLNRCAGFRYNNSIVFFNNYYSTTKDDVLALFDKVIAERKEKVT